MARRVGADSMDAEAPLPDPRTPITPISAVLPEWVALALVLAAALAVRLYAIERVPSVVFHDECDNLVNVYQILNGKGPGFFGFDWKPQPAASVYLQSVSMRLGMSVFALRFPTALLSVLALLPFYFLARRTVAAPAAMLATLLLAGDVWYLHFSRTGWEVVFVCLFLLAGALTLERAVSTGRVRSFVWAGGWSACGLYGYVSGRLVLPALLSIGFIELAWAGRERRRLAIGLLLMCLTSALLFAPQVPGIVSNWERFQSRTRFVYLLSGDNQDLPTVEKVSLVASNFAWKAQQLFTSHIPVPPIRERPDRYLRVDAGALARPTTALLVAGMILSVSGIALFRSTWRWWILLVLPFFATQALTIGSLNGSRGIIFLPVLYLFVALVLDHAWRVSIRFPRLLAPLLIAGTVALAASTTLDYFRWARSPELLQALQPAIPVAEFPQWQAYTLRWIAENDGFFNLQMWTEIREQQAVPAPVGGG
jgi:hypothetical protein